MANRHRWLPLNDGVYHEMPARKRITVAGDTVRFGVSDPVVLGTGLRLCRSRVVDEVSTAPVNDIESILVDYQRLLLFTMPSMNARAAAANVRQWLESMREKEWNAQQGG